MENKELSFQQFVRNLNENTLAQKYFKTRGLSKQIVKEELVGYCPAYSRYSFPLLRGRLIVPIRDVYGQTIALAGRQIPSIKDDLINKLMVGAVIGLLTWNIYTTQQLTIDIAVLQEKIEQLEEKLR